MGGGGSNTAPPPFRLKHFCGRGTHVDFQRRAPPFYTFRLPFEKHDFKQNALSESLKDGILKRRFYNECNRNNKQHR
jgi:hypothetical protein